MKILGRRVNADFGFFKANTATLQAINGEIRVVYKGKDCFCEL